MRGYIAKISTVEDRAKAVSLFGFALMLAVTVGPGLFFNLIDIYLLKRDNIKIDNKLYIKGEF